MPKDERSPTASELNDLARAAAALPSSQTLALLYTGEVDILGRMPWSSNATFLVTCRIGEAAVPAVYKPEGGERALWDFGPGIYRREVAAYVLSELLGLGIVPETVARFDGPMGVGSLQRFVPADFAQHYFTILEDSATHDRLRAMATFDVVANNADRKGGHVLIDDSGSIWGIDNGLCFHVEPKLRTVIWDLAGEPIPQALLPALCWLAGSSGGDSGSGHSDPRSSVRKSNSRDTDSTGTTGTTGTTTVIERYETCWSTLHELLEADELQAIRRRARRLVTRPRLPHPDERHHSYPWPLV